MPDSHIAGDVVPMLRWALRYQGLMYQLETEFQCGGRSAEKAVADFQQELPQVRMLQRWCAERIAQDKRAAVMCSKFAGVAGQLTDTALSRLELLQWREAGLEGARIAELTEDQVGHLTYLSYLHFANNNIDRSLELLDKAVSVSLRESDRNGYATALQHRGMLYARIDRVEEAIDAIQTAMTEYDAIGQDNARSKCLTALASCYARLQNHERAAELYQQAVVVEDGRAGYGATLCNLADSLISLRRLDEARKLLGEAGAAAALTGDGTLLGLVSAGLGRWHILQEDPDLRSEALGYFERALFEFRIRNERYHELNILSILRRLYTGVLEEKTAPLSYDQRSAALRGLIEALNSLGSHAEVIAQCEQLTRAAIKQRDLPDQLEAAIMAGHSAVMLKEYLEAIEWHTRAIDILARIRIRDDEPDVNLSAEAELLLSLGQAYRHTNRSDDAIRCYDAAEGISVRLGDKEMQYRAIGNLGLVHADSERYNEAMSQMTAVIEHYESQRNYRLLAHAQFNLAYVYYRKGDLERANLQGNDALRQLTLINDPNIEDVRSQMATWSK